MIQFRTILNKLKTLVNSGLYQLANSMEIGWNAAILSFRCLAQTIYCAGHIPGAIIPAKNSRGQAARKLGKKFRPHRSSAGI